MDDAEVAQRIKAEHRKLTQLIRELREVAGQMPDSDRDAWLNDLRTRFEHFRAHLHYRMALEEMGGFLAAVCERRPTLSRDVEHLRSQHREISKLSDEIHDMLGGVQPADDDRLRECQTRVAHVLSEVRHHQEHEDLLVAMVFSTDIGTGD